MNGIVSIIIPVYNVEKYLEKCVNSVLNQTYGNIEIILVNDGSTDSSGKICDLFKTRYENIKYIQKENGGLSSARNVGIEMSTGEYITFLDSDDFYDLYFIEKLIDSAVKYKSDLVISQLRDYYEYDKIVFDDKDENKSYSINKELAIKKMLLQDGMDVNATAKLYKKNVFDDIRFPEGKLYEDIQILDIIMDKVEIISYISYKGYYYLQRANSIMYGPMSYDRLILIDKTKQLICYLEDKYPSIVKAGIKRYVYCNFHLLGRSVLDKKYKSVSKQLRKNILYYNKFIFLSKYFTFKEKFATVILFFGLNLYGLFWKIFCNLKKILR